ncbi:MAG: hypothetical protein ACOCQD_01780 [archaeon]
MREIKLTAYAKRTNGLTIHSNLMNTINSLKNREMVKVKNLKSTFLLKGNGYIYIFSGSDIHKISINKIKKIPRLTLRGLSYYGEKIKYSDIPDKLLN